MAKMRGGGGGNEGETSMVGCTAKCIAISSQQVSSEQLDCGLGEQSHSRFYFLPTAIQTAKEHDSISVSIRETVSSLSPSKLYNLH